MTVVVMSHLLSAYCGVMEVWQGLWAGYGRPTVGPPVAGFLGEKSCIQLQLLEE